MTTSRLPYARTKRLDQDGQERHALVSTDDTGARAAVNVKGNGTQEYAALEIPIGTVSNPGSGQDIEVTIETHGNDAHNKIGRLSQPETTRFKASAGEHGSQDPADAKELRLHTEYGHRIRSKGKNGYGITVADIRGAFEIKKDTDGVVKMFIRCPIIVVSPPVVGTPPPYQDTDGA